jgi:hypothetical protein
MRFCNTGPCRERDSCPAGQERAGQIQTQKEGQVIENGFIIRGREPVHSALLEIERL